MAKAGHLGFHVGKPNLSASPSLRHLVQKRLQSLARALALLLGALLRLWLFLGRGRCLTRRLYLFQLAATLLDFLLLLLPGFHARQRIAGIISRQGDPLEHAGSYPLELDVISLNVIDLLQAMQDLKVPA